MDRTREYLATIPLLTISLVVINVTIHIIVFLFTIDVSPFTFSPPAVIYNGEYYRVFTSAFLHGGIMHIGMNMISLVVLGGMLEPAYGTLRFFWLTWLSILLTGMNYIFLAWASSVVLRQPQYFYSNAIGYSGVLFSYIVVDSFHSNLPSRSIFGLFSVPTKLYPIISLAIIQFVLPKISLFGHLGGLLAGIILLSTWGNDLLVPSQACFEWLETSCVCSCIVRRSSYALLTNKDLVHSYFAVTPGSICSCSAIGGLLRTLLMAVWSVIAFVGQVIYTVLYMIGCPIEPVTVRLQQCGNSCWNGLTSCGLGIQQGWQRIMGTFGNLSAGTMRQTTEGYELVNATAVTSPSNRSSTGVTAGSNDIEPRDTTFDADDVERGVSARVPGSSMSLQSSTSSNGARSQPQLSDRSPLHSKGGTIAQRSYTASNNSTSNSSSVGEAKGGGVGGGVGGGAERYYHRSKQSSRLLDQLEAARAAEKNNNINGR